MSTFAPVAASRGRVLARLAPFRSPGSYAAWGATLSVAYLVAGRLPPSVPWQVRAAGPVAVSASTFVAIVVGLRRHRPSPVWPWVVLATGRLAYTVADYITFSRAFSGGTLRFPSVADALYLAHYPLLIGAVVGLMRRDGRRRDATALLDASIVAVTSGLVVWLLVLQHYAVTPGPAFGRVVGMLYPVLDIATLSVTVRLLFGGGARTTSLRLLNLSVALLLAVDVAYNALLLDGSYRPGGAFDLGWLVTYVLLGAAALHTSMAARDGYDNGSAPRSQRPRLAVLGAATLVAPLMAVLVDGHDVEIAVSSAVLSLLVVVRFAGLIRTESAARAERAALLSQVLCAGERERTQLAFELHDGPIQRLAGLGLTLDAIEMTLDESSHTARRQVTRARDAILDEVRDLRRLMAGLRPPALDHGGLSGAVRDHVHEVMERSTVPVALQVALDDTSIDPDVETVLYRVTQEALANATKHARAGRIDVRLWSERDAVHVVVADDGIGIDRWHVDGLRDHFGLAAMRERSERVGGTCRVHTDSRGTTVHTTVPRHPAAPTTNAGRRRWPTR